MKTVLENVCGGVHKALVYWPSVYANVLDVSEFCTIYINCTYEQLGVAVYGLPKFV